MHSVPLLVESEGQSQSTYAPVPIFMKVSIQIQAPGAEAIVVFAPLHVRQSLEVPPSQVAHGSTQG